jgi:hypothetical protein
LIRAHWPTLGRSRHKQAKPVSQRTAAKASRVITKQDIILARHSNIRSGLKPPERDRERDEIDQAASQHSATIGQRLKAEIKSADVPQLAAFVIDSNRFSKSFSNFTASLCLHFGSGNDRRSSIDQKSKASR